MQPSHGSQGGSLFSTEADYMAGTETCKEAIWLKKFYHEICDSTSAESTPTTPTAQLIRIDI